MASAKADALGALKELNIEGLPVSLMLACSQGDATAGAAALDALLEALATHAQRDPRLAAAAINIANAEGWTPLLFAIRHGQEAMVARLLASGAGESLAAFRAAIICAFSDRPHLKT